jgi:hypothetical protein
MSEVGLFSPVDGGKPFHVSEKPTSVQVTRCAFSLLILSTNSLKRGKKQHFLDDL